MDCVVALQAFLALDRDHGGIADLRLEPSHCDRDRIDVVVVPYVPTDSEWVRLPAGVRDVLGEFGVEPAVSVERCRDRPVFLVASFPRQLDREVRFRRSGLRAINGP